MRSIEALPPPAYDDRKPNVEAERRFFGFEGILGCLREDHDVAWARKLGFG